MKPLVAVVGPTGIGKTRTGVRLGLQFRGEVVSADSRQVYRHMDIGTAKPTPGERASVPHHLIDIRDPGDEFSLALYQGLAHTAIEDIRGRGRLPLLVGGSGLYVWAVVEGWQLPQVPPDAGLRRSLEREAARDGGSHLYEELRRLDPAAASEIDPRNVRRVIRALEVIRLSGVPLSASRGKRPPSCDVMVVGLTAARGEVYRRADARVEAMMAGGLVEEVRFLAERYGYGHPAMSGIGYRETGMYLRGEICREEAMRRIKVSTHRLIRHQYAWFRPGDERIRWFDVQEPGAQERLVLEVGGFLAGG